MSQKGIHAFISAEEAVHAHDGVERQNPAAERSESGDIMRAWKLNKLNNKVIIILFFT